MLCINVLLICLNIAFSLVGLNEEADDGNVIMFWNLENFFDYSDGGTGESDSEFTPGGKRHWTSGRFYDKCRLIAKAIFWTGDRYGRMPDVIGVAEVENRSVLSRLLSSTGLRKHGYRVVHHDSGDRRGIDVALLYRSDVFEFLDHSVTAPVFQGEKMSTRDILSVRLRRISDGKVFDFIVNHHPSKFGGSRESGARRDAAMRTLCSVCDSLIRSDVDSYAGIIAMGDFNDTPDAPQFSLLEGTLENATWDLFTKGEGTIRFEGKWDLIDMFLVSRPIFISSVCEIPRIPFLMTRERKHPGEKPLRTYSGPRYLGGVSDHCPVVLRIF